MSYEFSPAELNVNMKPRQSQSWTPSGSRRAIALTDTIRTARPAFSSKIHQIEHTNWQLAIHKYSTQHIPILPVWLKATVYLVIFTRFNLTIFRILSTISNYIKSWLCNSITINTNTFILLKNIWRNSVVKTIRSELLQLFPKSMSLLYVLLEGLHLREIVNSWVYCA